MYTTLRKYCSLVFLFSLAITPLAAQECLPTASYNLNVNNVNARINIGGDLWFDGAQGVYEVSNDDTSPTAIFSAGLWMGGKDSLGQLHLAAQSYGRSQNNFEFLPGPLNHDGTPIGECDDWDKVFSVTREDVDFIRAYNRSGGSYPIPLEDIPENILGWPGLGNRDFENIHGFPISSSGSPLAPYWDFNGTGSYEPQYGDYPLFLGDEASWLVMHEAPTHTDGGSPGETRINMEVQILSYAYNADHTDLNNTTFYEFKFIHQGEETLNDFYFGQFIDTDLGCSNNDLIGTAPEHDLFYFYNDANTPETTQCQGMEGYGTQSPVNTFRILEAKVFNILDTTFLDGLNRLIAYSPASLDGVTSLPQSPEERYRGLAGLWRDGTPITAGGNGYNPGSTDTVNHVYSGNYNTEYDWSMCNETGVQSQGDRAVYSIGPVLLQAGAFNRFTLGVTTYFDVPYVDGCPDLTDVLADSDSLQHFFDDQVDSIHIDNQILSSVNEVATGAEIGLIVYPNPARESIQFALPETISKTITTLRVMDITGRVIDHYTVDADQFKLLRNDQRAGTYFYQLVLSDGHTVGGKFIWR